MKKAILFAALSILGTGAAMAAPAHVAPKVTVTSAMDQAYQLGAKLGAEFGQNSGSTTNGAVEVVALHNAAVTALNAEMKADGLDYGMSAIGQLDLQAQMMQSFWQGVNSTSHQVTPFVK